MKNAAAQPRAVRQIATDTTDALRYLAVLSFFSPVQNNVCVTQPVSVSRIVGHVVYVGRAESWPGDGISAELWQTKGDGSRALLANTITDASGYFSFGKTLPGSYDLVFKSPVATGGFFVQVRGPGVFRWFRNNWLEIALGLVQPEGCPPSYARALRKRRMPAGLPNTPEPTAEKRNCSASSRYAYSQMYRSALYGSLTDSLATRNTQ